MNRFVNLSLVCLMIGLIVYQQICVFHIKRLAVVGREPVKWPARIYIALAEGREGRLITQSHSPVPIMPHLVKLLMFYAMKLQFISTNNTDSNGKLDSNRF